MISKFDHHKVKARTLRSRGKTYREINQILKVPIPKSTLSYWCRDVRLPPEYEKRIKQLVSKNAERGRAMALIVNKRKREQYMESLRKRVQHLPNKIKNKDTAKIALTMLYLGEGGKKNPGFVRFSNSDPDTVRFFLYLFRFCYDVNETKFRCTVMCRADQDTSHLERFWRSIVKIPSSQFYKTRIDPRTFGKPSRKKDYKGVCCIDYFSSEVYNELLQAIDVLIR